MDPAALNGSLQRIAGLYAFHADAVFRNVAEGNIPDLKALAEIRIAALADKMQAPAVDAGIIADALDRDILAGLHSGHEAVIADGTAVVIGIICGQPGRSLDIADDTDHERCTVLCELLDDALIGIGGTALGCLAAACFLTG